MGRQYKSFRERVFAKVLRATNELEVMSGATFNLKGTEVTSTAAELNLNDNQVAGATIVVGAEAANVINVAIQFTDAAGADMATAVCVPWYIAGDAVGQTIGTAASVGASIGTDGLLQEYTANLSGLLTSEADGDADIDIEEAGALSSYLVLVMPNGSLVISDEILHAA